MSKWLIFLPTNNFYRLFSSRLFLYQWGIKGRPVNNDYSIDSQNFEIIDKIPKFKAGEVVGIVSIRTSLPKDAKEIHQEKYLMSLRYWILFFGVMLLKI